MPAESQAQYRFMQKAAHDAAFAREQGISQDKAREYVAGQSPKGLPERVKRAVKSATRKLRRRRRHE